MLPKALFLDFKDQPLLLLEQFDPDKVCVVIEGATEQAVKLAYNFLRNENIGNL